MKWIGNGNGKKLTKCGSISDQNQSKKWTLTEPIMDQKQTKIAPKLDQK